MTPIIQHSFAICAYGRSQYLEECIQSVLQQDVGGSEVFISTSTPSSWLDGIAEKYNLPIFINDGESGIGQDWNYAYSRAHGKYVTIAHQDDIYCPGYVATAVSMLDRAKKPILFFCDYGELRGDAITTESLNLSIKKWLLRGLRNGRNADNIRTRRRALSFGCAISCPSVTLVKENCPDMPYQTKMKCSLDWDTWEHLSRIEGSFIYSTDVLMYHRIHEESATTRLIGDRTRLNEDREMYERFWPKPIASFLTKLYSISLSSNQS